MRDDWRKAAIDGDAGVIERLLAEGVDVDCLDQYAQTALMLAALYGRDDVVRLLLSKGADTDVTAKFRLSALMFAVINHHAGIAECLVGAGANTALRGSGASGFAGKSAFDLAEHNGQTDLAALIARADGRDTPRK